MQHFSHFKEIQKLNTTKIPYKISNQVTKNSRELVKKVIQRENTLVLASTPQFSAQMMKSETLPESDENMSPPERCGSDFPLQ